MNFCMMTHVGYPEHSSCSKVKFSKIQDGGRCRMIKLSNAFPSWWVTKSLSIVKSKLADSYQLEIDKNFNFLLFFTEKQDKSQLTSILYRKTAKKSANNRFHVKLVKYSNFYDIRADVWPILMKFCMMTHIGYPEHNSFSKSEIWQNSRWWTLPFDKIVKSDISAIVSLILM